MKKIVLASACMLALAAGPAMAQMQQTQPTNGASSEGNVGPGAASGSAMKHSNMKKGTTTGLGKGMPGASSEGNVGPGTDNNAGPRPGSR